MLYTAQYRYPGNDRLDITVKGNNVAGKIYAPTWEMVNKWKVAELSDEDYTSMYYDLLINRFHNMKDFKETTFKMIDMLCGTNDMPERDLTLVCFCHAGSFCHRYLFVNWLTFNYPQVKYGGEKKKMSGNEWAVI